MNNIDASHKFNRVISLDLIRVLACFMVIMVHSGEFFYIGPGDVIIRNHAFWVNTYGSLLRACVPLFVVISGYLMIPIKEESELIFYKKRFGRIIIPFLFWSAVYVMLPYFGGEYGFIEMVNGIVKIPLSWGRAGHLWYIYMLIGVYLFIPFISPWYKGATQKSKQIFLAIWALTLFTHFIHRIYPEILGESHWNEIHTLYYFSGYTGYLVLGAYFREYFQTRKLKFVGAILFLIGYVITFYGFDANILTAQKLPELEVTWRFTTINVAMMTIGIFFLLKDVKILNPKLRSIIVKMSELSYGVYLAHIVVLTQVYNLLQPSLVHASITIPTVAVGSFIITYFLIKMLSYIPGSKYLVG